MDATARPRSRTLPVLAIAQLALVALFALGDVGFDRPGRFGLDFGHGLAILAALAVLWIAGTWISVRRKAWSWLGFELALPVAGFALALVLGL